MDTTQKLKQYIERIERLEQEKTEVGANIRDIYADAKSNGLEPKIMRLIIKMRKKRSDELQEEEMLVETYKRALGMQE